MKIKLTHIVLLLMFATPLQSFAQNNLLGIGSWLCFYDNAFPTKEIPRYDLYILDSSNHPDLVPLKTHGSKVVGYVSFGEVNKTDPRFDEFMREGLLVEENENWPGSHRVDIRNDKWHSYVLNTLIPKTLSEGFDGIFIDTIDTAHYLEQVKGMKGASRGAIKLLKEVRKKYPNLIIILNNGLSLLNDVGMIIDALLIEDVYTLYDFKKKQYKMAADKWSNERLIPLKEFQDKFQKPVLTLDYLKPRDKKNIRKVAKKAKAQGFIPYVSDIDLKTIFFKNQ
ncbi:MAG: endo alpha-1,4 polygalactosaminidase [Pseudomonadota bacterium]